MMKLLRAALAGATLILILGSSTSHAEERVVYGGMCSMPTDVTYLGTANVFPEQLVWLGGPNELPDPTSFQCEEGEVAAVLGTADGGNDWNAADQDCLNAHRGGAVGAEFWADAPKTSTIGQGAAVWCVPRSQVTATWGDLDAVRGRLGRLEANQGSKATATPATTSTDDNRHEFGIGAKLGTAPGVPFGELRLTADLYTERFANVGLHLEGAIGAARTTQVRPTGSFVIGVAIRPTDSFRLSVGGTSREVMRHVGESVYTRLGGAATASYLFESGFYLGGQFVLANGVTASARALQAEGGLVIGFSTR